MLYADVVRMADQWAELTRGVPGRSRSAILTRDPLAVARINSCRDLYPNVQFGIFNGTAAAREWFGHAPALID